VSDRFDLHVHSTASDGSLGPAEVVREAASQGVAGIALTDHDTIIGLPEATAEGEVQGVQVVPGVEISVSEADGDREMHILALGIDPDSPELTRRLEEARRERLERGLRMVERLRGIGIEIPEELIRRPGARGSVGRTHVAKALVRMGICRTFQEAFDRFIGRRGPAYVSRRAVTASEAIQMAHDANGIAVLAHPPLSVGVTAPGGLDEFVSRVAHLGLDGIEVEHPNVRPSQRRRLTRLARLHELVSTGGSDFHGESKPDVSIGRGRGDIHVGPEAFRAVLDRIRDRRRGG
jgi:predicted metal-dependent phosphoesterase TrpH